MIPNQKSGEPIHCGEKLPEVSNVAFISKPFRLKVISILNAVLNLRVKLSNGYALVTITANGILVDLTRIVAAAGSARGLPMVFMGEYTTDAQPYFAGEFVTITVGINAGTYVSLIDSNTFDPWNSANWKKLPAAPQTSNWQ